MKTSYLISILFLSCCFISVQAQIDGNLPSISINNQTSLEGDIGDANIIIFTVSLSNPSDQPITVGYANSEETAYADVDYVTVGGVLTFPAFTTSQELTFEIIGDNIDEPDEIFHVVLFSATNATIANATGIATIVDDDETPTISINDATIIEGNNTNSIINFNIVASHLSASPISFNFQTMDGSAIAGDDYIANNGNATVSAKSLTSIISVEVIGDYLIENDEIFNVVLSEANNALINDNTAIATIENDDEGADLALSLIVTPEVAEVSETLTYTIQVTNNGPEIALDTVMTLNLFENVVFLEASLSQGTCSHTHSIVTCLMGNIGNNESIEIIVNSQITGIGTINTLANVSSGISDDSDFSNNSASITVTSTALNIPSLSLLGVYTLILIILFVYYRKI